MRLSAFEPVNGRTCACLDKRSDSSGSILRCNSKEQRFTVTRNLQTPHFCTPNAKCKLNSLPSWRFVKREREKPAKTCAKREERAYPVWQVSKKRWGKGWVGEWKDGKKGNWGERVRDVLPFVLFSPSPFCACHASYDARALFS